MSSPTSLYTRRKRGPGANDRRSGVDIAAHQARACIPRASMADISEFSIVTYERKPGCWRAAITRKGSAGPVVGGDKVRSVVTPDDYATCYCPGLPPHP